MGDTGNIIRSLCRGGSFIEAGLLLETQTRVQFKGGVQNTLRFLPQINYLYNQDSCIIEVKVSDRK